MKTTLITSVIAIVMTLGFAAVAQRPSGSEGREQRREQHMERMKAELNLTDAQVRQITTLKETHMAQCGKRSRNGEGPVNREHCATARKEYRQAVSNVLTPQQREIMEARRQERSEQRQAHGKKGGRGNGPKGECRAPKTFQ